MNPNQNQQGDILLEKVDQLPTGCKLVKRSQNCVILAESQVTNNRHYILERGVNLFTSTEGTKYIVNENETEAGLEHSKDHLPIRVAPGIHRIGVVNERDHLAGMTRSAED